MENLRKQAQEQYDKVKKMNFMSAMQYTNGGYNQFRLIYEKPGKLGDYLYPSHGEKNQKSRKDLYEEFAFKANQLFREMMEEYTLGVDETISKEDRDNMYRDAWNRGHANGYNEVWNYYQDVTDLYGKIQSGNITRDEFDEYLDI